MSYFNDKCYVAKEDYDDGDCDNDGHTENPLSSKIALSQESYMPDLAVDENSSNGEIVDDPLKFCGALDPLDNFCLQCNKCWHFIWGYGYSATENCLIH